MPTVRDRIHAHLDAVGVPYEVIDHPRAQTAEEAAAVRGTPLAIGGKTLLLKIGKGDRFGLFVVSGARTVDSRRIRRHLGVQRLRFATPDELRALTGLTPGCVPPFGPPVFDLPLFADTATVDQDRIAFALGTHTASAVMRVTDWRAAAVPEVFDLSRRTG